MTKMQDQSKALKEMIKSYGLNREGMRGLKEWVLNNVMNEEAEEQPNASRYEMKSTIYTSNKSFSEWGEILEEAMASAVLDRIQQHCEHTCRILQAGRQNEDKQYKYGRGEIKWKEI